MPEKLRAILDTNVYGILLASKPYLIPKISNSERLIIYGFEVIRKELRAIPKTEILYDENFRMEALKLYDSIVKNHNLEANGLIAKLATNYAESYNGGISKEKLQKDFLIVAAATIHRLDIIVSADQHSMQSAPARRAYTEINEKYQLPSPKFYSMTNLEKLL